eukprot:TRINITY_DN10644_c0_g1_i1.p1 TRINITY_DN10644_c0_g1~~TRINITY_DN10644_c0_g1_i1.p1  ORF type:complete len:548 (+),score=83.39 TRINITY_DN10644_c0_g1_i1:145-1788(+)
MCIRDSINAEYGEARAMAEAEGTSTKPGVMVLQQASALLEKTMLDEFLVLARDLVRIKECQPDMSGTAVDLFLIALTRTHDRAAHADGLLQHPDLQQWLTTPLVQVCLHDHAARLDKIRNAVNLRDPSHVLMIRAQSLLSYIVGDYESVRTGYEILLNAGPGDELKQECVLMMSLACCHLADYRRAVQINPMLNSAWELLKPCADEAFAARRHRMEQEAGDRGLAEWGDQVVSQTEALTIVCLSNGASFGGLDPMVYNDTTVYVGVRGSAKIQPVTEPPAETVREAIVPLCTNPGNYYHSFVELGALLVAWQELDEAPCSGPIYICAASEQAYGHISAVLSQFLPEEVVTEIRFVSHHVHADKLWVLDKGLEQPAVSVWDAIQPTEAALLRLRERTRPQDGAGAGPRRLVYAARRKTLRGFGEDGALVQALQEWCAEHGVEYAECEGKRPIHEQRELYGTALVIFGVHGSGLCNIMWAPDDCMLVEIPMKNMCNLIFLNQTQTLGMQHRFVPGWDCVYHRHLPDPTPDQIQALIHTLPSTTHKPSSD